MDSQAMQHDFPLPQPDFELHLTREELTLFHAKKGQGLPPHRLGMEAYGQWQLPRLAAEYLLRCDGQTRHRDICGGLNAPFRFMVDQVAQHLAEKTGAISMARNAASEPSRVAVTGSFDSFAPLHMSVEITDTCNFRCDHCYVSSSPDKLARRHGPDLFSLFETMRENGVRIVELTGGECTTHPEFKEILACASRTFHLVAIVSNGYLIGTRDGLADWIASFDNVCCQVSIDGDEEFHDAFRKKAGAYAGAVEAVRRLSALGLLVRVAMTITSENVEQAAHVYRVAKESGAQAFSVAPATGFGRGAAIQSCGSQDRQLQARLREVLAPFANDPLFEFN